MCRDRATIGSKIKEKRYLKTNENDNMMLSKILYCSKSGIKREVYSIAGLSQESGEKNQTNNITLNLKELKQ